MICRPRVLCFFRAASAKIEAMRTLVMLLVLAACACAQSRAPEQELARLEAERRELDAQLHGRGTLRARADAAVAEELPRLEKAAREHPTADALTAYATALAGAGQLAPALAEARKATAADPKHELAAATARELARFDGANGPQVLAALVAARHALERREEVAEARRSLPALQARAAQAPDAAALLELAAAQVVLEAFPAALDAARKLLALDPKHRIAHMLVDELTRPDLRDPEAVRTAITMRWLELSAAPPAAR